MSRPKFSLGQKVWMVRNLIENGDIFRLPHNPGKIKVVIKRITENGVAYYYSRGYSTYAEYNFIGEKEALALVHKYAQQMKKGLSLPS